VDSSIKTPAAIVEKVRSPPRLSKYQLDAYELTDVPTSPKLLLPLFDEEGDDPTIKFPRFNLMPKVRESIYEEHFEKHHPLDF
jgi:hypothetical protein